MVAVGQARTDRSREASLEFIRQRIDEHVETGRSPSVAAIVLERGETIFSEARGIAHPDGRPLTLDHVWPIASAGKSFVAATLMSLVEDGLVGVTEFVVDHFPEIAEGGEDERRVLIHHLLTHTTGWESPLISGRRNEVFQSGAAGSPPRGVDPYTHLDLYLARHPIRVAQPGEVMEYASVHYGVICEIIRRITGTSLHDAMSERLLRPLGMDRTAVQVPVELLPELVVRERHLPFGSADATGDFSLQEDDFRAADDGTASVHCSPRDMARYGQMILDQGVGPAGRVLSRASIEAMTTNQIVGVPAKFGGRVVSEAWWGYGFIVISTERYPYFGGVLPSLGSVNHPGAGGVSFWVDFDREIVGVFFEVLTEMSMPYLEPLSGIGQRFQDMVTAAVTS